MKTYILRAPNGDWLVLKDGAQDRLLGVTTTRDKALRLQRKLKEAA